MNSLFKAKCRLKPDFRVSDGIFCRSRQAARADCADGQSHSDGHAERMKMPSERRLRPVCRIPPAFKTAVEINAIFQYGRFDWPEMMRRPPYQKIGRRLRESMPRPPQATPSAL
ncbi:hypothetical protein F528_1395 [Neisseria meningitidis 992008]|nr:hypothetical protein F528_1395 [Neisseria meningitidis 992008]